MNIVETLDGKIHTVMDDPHCFSELVGEYMGSDAKKFFDNIVDSSMSYDNAENLVGELMDLEDDIEDLETKMENYVDEVTALKAKLKDITNHWDRYF